MTTLAGSGHPGGSMSSLDFYVGLYSHADIDPINPDDPDRDRIIISHGHTPPGVYAALGRTGCFPVEAAITTTGGMVYQAVEAWKKLNEKGVEVQVLNLSCLTDLDIDAILKAAGTGKVITDEDPHIQTGLGSLIANVIAENGLSVRLRKMGITQYGSSGKPEGLYRIQGLDVDSLVKVVTDEVMGTSSPNTMHQ